MNASQDDCLSGRLLLTADLLTADLLTADPSFRSQKRETADETGP